MRLPLGLGCLLAGAALAAAAQEQAASGWFENRTAAARVERPHVTRTFKNPYANVMQGYTALGAAAAVADFDGDGWEDVFFTVSSEDGKNLLYRNEGDFTFTEVGAAAGVAEGNDPQNASADALWFDYDDDGDQDLLVVRFGQNLLYENRGKDAGGVVRFADVTKRAGLERYLNCIVAIAFDYDKDGDLDLFLGNYFAPVNLFNPETPRFFPESFETARNGGGVTLFRNNGDRTFSDVTVAAGIVVSGWTLDLGHADADLDGDEDLYVAADFGTDSFFRNNGDGSFTDVSKQAIGIDTKKGMNVDWGDFDNDGLFDVFVTNITDEYMKEGNFLWKNLGELHFTDVARETGTHATGWGWAGKFFDYDNDGWLDLYVVNGWVSQSADPKDNYVLDIFKVIVDPSIDLADARNWPPMGKKTLSGFQRKSLFHNQGGTFKDEAKRHGVDSIEDARGIAVADFDQDGRLDMFVTNSGKAPYLWRNAQPTGNHWLQLHLTGAGSNRDAVGARVRVRTAERWQTSFVNGGNGFASQSTRAVHFGLAGASRVDRIEVIWPSGLQQVFENVAADRALRLTEGGSDLLAFAPKGRNQ
ncbi:MAG: CRTAC1 family protein [Vicinamibacteria bacterium]